jgi:hypothetical protein
MRTVVIVVVLPLAQLPDEEMTIVGDAVDRGHAGSVGAQAEERSGKLIDHAQAPAARIAMSIG